MTTVALDASALMAPVELDLRLFDELDRLLSAGVPVIETRGRTRLEITES